VRAAGAKYQQSGNGRRNHAERQRRYRERQRAARVTHQAYSAAAPVSAIVGAVSVGEAAIDEAVSIF
jgi:hypothetical protein